MEPWLLTLDLSRCLGLELFSFHALLFCLVFDCGMGCMSLSLLVKVWVLLKFQSIVFFYNVDCPLFLPFLQLFLFHFSFSRDLRLHGGLRTYRLFAFTHVVFGLVCLPWECFSRKSCLFFSTWSPTLETCYAVSVSP